MIAAHARTDLMRRLAGRLLVCALTLLSTTLLAAESNTNAIPLLMKAVVLADSSDDLESATPKFLALITNSPALQLELADKIVARIVSSDDVHPFQHFPPFLAQLKAHAQLVTILSHNTAFECCFYSGVMEALEYCMSDEDVPRLIPLIDKENDTSGPVIRRMLANHLKYPDGLELDREGWAKWWKDRKP